MFLYLMGRAHEDVVGDFAKGYSQINDIILCAAAFREVADVNDSACCGLSGWKWLKMIKTITNMNVEFSQQPSYC